MSTSSDQGTARRKVGFSGLFRKTTRDDEAAQEEPAWSKSSLGILSDKQTAEVPGEWPDTQDNCYLTLTRTPRHRAAPSFQAQ